jgi:phage terminase large subunit
LLTNESPYLVLIGGAGSGKSEAIARKLFYRCIVEGGHRFLVLRKVRSRVRESVMAVMLAILRDNNIPFEMNKSDRVLTFGVPGRKPNEILFDGLDDPDKIKSIVGVTGIWMEEATEFTREDFMQLDLRLRGETPFYKQIILSLNPDEAAGAWIKDEFCFDDTPTTGPGKRPGSFVHHSTIEDNPIKAVRDEYTAKLEAIGDKTYYAIYRQGVWALAKGIIYTWDVVEWPAGGRGLTEYCDEVFYGLDFGYSVDPAALVRIYRKADEFWLEEVIYSKGLTNPMLAAQIRAAGITGDDQIYADAAEPKSIAELRGYDLAVYPCDKGQDSVRSGIDYLKGKKIHILQGSDNILHERRTYKYKEAPDGRALPEPVKFSDHAMDAIRYGIVTHMNKSAGWGISFV